jgi:hypothetical protein
MPSSRPEKKRPEPPPAETRVLPMLLQLSDSPTSPASGRMKLREALSIS